MLVALPQLLPWLPGSDPATRAKIMAALDLDTSKNVGGDPATWSPSGASRSTSGDYYDPAPWARTDGNLGEDPATWSPTDGAPLEPTGPMVGGDPATFEPTGTMGTSGTGGKGEGKGKGK